jgi:hypothetical protein
MWNITPKQKQSHVYNNHKKKNELKKEKEHIHLRRTNQEGRARGLLYSRLRPCQRSRAQAMGQHHHAPGGPAGRVLAMEAVLNESLARAAPPPGQCRPRPLLTEKTRIHIRSSSVWTYTFFTTGTPQVLVNPWSKGLTSI